MSEEKPKKKNWIKSAIPEKNKGKFAAKAKDAGKSTQAFAKDHEGDKDKLGKEARLAETLGKMSHKKNRKALYGSKE